MNLDVDLQLRFNEISRRWQTWMVRRTIQLATPMLPSRLSAGLAKPRPCSNSIRISDNNQWIPLRVMEIGRQLDQAEEEQHLATNASNLLNEISVGFRSSLEPRGTK